MGQPQHPVETQEIWCDHFPNLQTLLPGKKIIMLTDENVYQYHPAVFAELPTIITPSGEKQKNLETVAFISERLIHFHADRDTLLVAIGGGMITDLGGFTASVFMRGISFGIIPSTLLGMVDAAIGGKTGVNLGTRKNMIGTFRQPHFICWIPQLLKSLPDKEWSHGFAEIIKYACLFDPALFSTLQRQNTAHYQHRNPALQCLIQKCVTWKNKIVAADETENGNRKLLNFGHTIGHALERSQNVAHGLAVAVGMVMACSVSEKVAGLPTEITEQLKSVLSRFDLPSRIHFDPDKVWEVMTLDKKRKNGLIDFIVLHEIGQPAIHPLHPDSLRPFLYNDNSPKKH